MTRRLALFLLAIPAWAQRQSNFDVIRAGYGPADVTGRVRSKIVNGGLNIQVDVETLGLGPLPDSRKTLIIEYRQDGTRRTAFANDFDTLRIGAVTVESLRITKAEYGDGNRMTDVAEILNSGITANRLELVINNANLGGDPTPGVRKTITVDYEYNGRAATARFAEGETLRLPDGTVAPSAPASTLRIASAIYLAVGGRARFIKRDVTATVRSLVVDNALELTVSAAALKADPSPGTPKMLLMSYGYNGHLETVSLKDGEVLRIMKAH